MKPKLTIAALGFLALIGLPVLLVATIPTPEFSLASILVGLILLYSSVRLARLSVSKAQQIVTTTFWLFVYIFFGVCPLLQLSSNTFPWYGNYEPSLLVKTGFIILVGLFAFDIGHHLHGRSQGFAVPKLLLRRVSKVAIVLLSTLSLGGAAYILHALGGLNVLFLARSERFQALSSQFELPQLLLLTSLATTPVYVLLIAALAVCVARLRNGWKVEARWKGMTFILLAATLVLNNPISTPRLKVGTILLSLFFILPWRRWSGVVTVGGLIFALLVVFPFADLFRYSLDVNLTERLAATSPIREFTKKADFDAFQMTANAVSVMEKSDHRLGRQLGGALLFWAPRSIWPQKPIATGQWIAEQKGYRFTNLSSPLWVEFYVDGGWFLLVIGFVGYGYLVRTLDRWHARSHIMGEVSVVSVLVPIFAGYQFFLLRGALMSAVAYFAPILLVALLCSVPRITDRSRRRLLSRSAGGAESVWR